MKHVSKGEDLTKEKSFKLTKTSVLVGKLLFSVEPKF